MTQKSRTKENKVNRNIKQTRGSKTTKLNKIRHARLESKQAYKYYPGKHLVGDLTVALNQIRNLTIIAFYMIKI